MTGARAAFTLDEETAERARRPNIDISPAARQGVTGAVRPSRPDPTERHTNGCPSRPIRSGTKSELGARKRNEPRR